MGNRTVGQKDITISGITVSTPTTQQAPDSPRAEEITIRTPETTTSLTTEQSIESTTPHTDTSDIQTSTDTSTLESFSKESQIACSESLESSTLVPISLPIATSTPSKPTKVTKNSTT